MGEDRPITSGAEESTSTLAAAENGKKFNGAEDEVSSEMDMELSDDEYVFEIQADAYSDEELRELIREKAGGGKISKGKMTYIDGSYYVSEFDVDGNIVKDTLYFADGSATCYEYEYGTDSEAEIRNWVGGN